LVVELFQLLGTGFRFEPFEVIWIKTCSISGRIRT